MFDIRVAFSVLCAICYTGLPTAHAQDAVPAAYTQGTTSQGTTSVDDLGFGPGWGDVSNPNLQKRLKEVAEQFDDSDLVLRYGSPDTVFSGVKLCCQGGSIESGYYQNCRRYFLFCGRTLSVECSSSAGGAFGVKTPGNWRWRCGTP